MKTITDVNRENDFMPNGDWEYKENILDKLVKSPTRRKGYDAQLKYYDPINKGKLVVSV